MGSRCFRLVFRFSATIRERIGARKSRQTLTDRKLPDGGPTETFNGPLSSGPIISMTTYPDRFPIAVKAVRHLLGVVSSKAHVVVYLSDPEIAAYSRTENQDIESYLLQLRSMVNVEIREEMIGPYGKFWWAVQEYSGRPIITVDDDCYYHRRCLETLFRHADSNKSEIISVTGRRVIYASPDSGAKFRPTREEPLFLNAANYDEWPLLKRGERKSVYGDRFMLRGVGGVLYPSSLLEMVPDLLDIELWTRLSPSNDDLFVSDILWRGGLNLKVLGMLGSTSILPSQGVVGLERLNVRDRANDRQAAALASDRGFGFRSWDGLQGLWSNGHG